MLIVETKGKIPENKNLTSLVSWNAIIWGFIWCALYIAKILNNH